MNAIALDNTASKKIAKKTIHAEHGAVNSGRPIYRLVFTSFLIVFFLNIYLLVKKTVI